MRKTEDTLICGECGREYNKVTFDIDVSTCMTEGEIKNILDGVSKYSYENLKIDRIKVLRNWFKATKGYYIGLKEAKDVVEAVYGIGG